MTSLQWAMILYMAVVLAVGLGVSRYVKNVTDYLLAGRRLGIILCSATLAATHLGGGFVLGSGEYGYQHGVSGVWYGAACGIGLVVLGLVFARALRSLALFTVADYLERRYGGRTVRGLAALLSLIAIVGILAAQVKAAEGIMVTLGFAPVLGAIIATLIFIVYTAAAGMWAVTMTDLLQLVVAVGGVVVAAMLGLSRVGGWGAVQRIYLEPRHFSLFGIGGGTIMWLLIPTVMYTVIGQDFYQRLFSSRDENVARTSSVLAGVILVAAAFFPVLAGMAAHVKFPDLVSARAAIPMLVTAVFPPFLAGLVLAAVMAAVMSTADSLLCAGTSHVIRDLYVGVFRRQAEMESRSVLRWSMFTTVVLGLFALLIAFAVPGIISALITAYVMYTAGVFFPVVGGFLWKRATREGAIAGMAVGLVVALLATTKLVRFGPLPEEISGALFSLVAFVVVSLLTKPGEQAQRV